MKKRSYCVKSKIIASLTALCIALTVLSFMNSARLSELEREAEVQRQKYLSELCESLDSMTVSLNKSLYAASSEMLQETGNLLARQSAVAKVSLSGITDEGIVSDELYKFLSQAGEYALYLSRKNREKITDKERERLRALYEYSRYLTDSFEQISNDYFSGSLAFIKKVNSLLDEESTEKSLFTEAFNDVRQTMGDYPTLIYDGPFADALINKKPLGLRGDEITVQEAKKKAAEYLGCEQSSLKREEDVNSEIELYRFSLGERSVSLTKKGGMLCTMTDPVYAGEVSISTDEAIKRGREYLEKTGFEKNMKETYYSTYDGICTVNYAFTKNGITYYADLIKVSISLETGKAVAADSRGYLMNHGERESSKARLTASQCRNRLLPELTVLKEKMAMIPLETGKEALCYEFHCKDEKGQEALIYINAKNGTEENILLLLYGDGGVLTK